ncbi:HalOD1 output domain-containing protein [Natrialbaceae archaeon GCM10025810]|uniref:HalOD1 output domain-containing protein n=1 Tax=Halovalidus salilacus TaxID=3075124 RepID=UPI00361EA10D
MVEQRTDDATVTFSENTISPVTAEWGRTSEETPVVAVISAVADAASTEMLALPPLYEAIDPEALNDLFTARPGAPDCSVSFRYAGFDVVVSGDGTVQVE